MNEVDLTNDKPKSTYRVSTIEVRNGKDYMGPDVKIHADNSWDAVVRVKNAGHKINPHFRPEELK